MTDDQECALRPKYSKVIWEQDHIHDTVWVCLLYKMKGFAPVEINEDRPNENKQSLLEQRTSHSHLHLAKNQRHTYRE